jgi:cytochrome b561
MRWRNGPADFGLLTRLLHWLMAAGVIAMLALGTTLTRMEPGLANLWLYGLHKTIGICLLALVPLRLVWHRISPPPPPIGPPAAWETRLARLAHLSLYALLLIIPLSGWSASSATGIDVLFLDRWTLPPLAPVSEAWENAGFAVHGVATKLLMVVLLLHIAGALWRAWAGDGTMRRMLTGRA